ncbi:cyclophilin-like protein [Comamonas sp. BIGb0124]|uniref:cyclophilin-like fold protein n=1 Tax=Comamonas sp. BIGb0124 TaxID=2485130 RepID=UPI000F46CDD2|nr:cyclophilin-like fold protein [Comamonas sp. BIGb0124]ROR17919.1 cyclophilin-like protein [Comamonas sp. BIGb0124]
MNIRLTVNDQVATATLYDNATAQGFAALLPLSLTLVNYARIERIADLPSKLPRSGDESAVPVKAGDLAYYAPWGNLAIFVQDGPGNYTGDLMRLGAVNTGLPALQRPGPLPVRIERDLG